MDIGSGRIVEEWPVAREIVVRLAESHAQVTFEIKSAEYFGFFSRWVQQLSSRYPNASQATELSQLAADLTAVFSMGRESLL